jgi:hypothetical protein
LAAGIPPGEGVIVRVQKSISNIVAEALVGRSKYVHEDPETEYLFLLGVEARLFKLDWYALSFNVGTEHATGGSWFKLS